MKKIFKNISVLFLCLALCTAMILPSAANESGIGQSRKPIVSIISEQNEIGTDDYIHNTEAYDESLTNFNPDNEVAIRIYREAVWSFGDDSIETLINTAESEFAYTYTVFGETPMMVSKYTNNNGITWRVYGEIFETPPTYVRDIINSNIYNSKLVDEKDTFSKIMCFDATNGHWGITVYYLNGNNGIVRHYDNYLSECVEYTLSDFQKYSVEYNAYISSYEQNYNENGDELYGGTVTFSEFMNNREKYDSEVQEQLKERTIKIVIYIIAGVLVVAIVGVIIFKAVKSRKNRKLSPQRAGAGEESPTSEEDSQNE